ncbi:virulence factor lipase-like protein [Bradymonas sediminis]|uniref:Uncharacterized protein n=2 Tax=Bradymonas sediminis TaxID=1548548 RepID=A0A2Z4FLZ1_9DELT|nr:hypothetical protein DN745_11880 [Bradymonas sediminis]TDP76045.1 virulence factor lipase-like protein [Bradymonas sediminis]
MKIFRKPRSYAWTAGPLALALMAFAVGCAEEVPVDEDIQRVSIVFDPAIPAIPLPSDLALEEDGTMPNLGADLQASAQADFYAYVGTLHGWLPGSNTITIPTSGEINPDSLGTENVRVFKFNADGTTSTLDVAEVKFNAVETPSAEDGGAASMSYEIAAKIATPLTLSSHYGFVLTGDIKDTDNNQVVRSQAIHFATFETPLVDENGVATVDLLAGQDETAQSLEGLRQFLAPTVTAALEADPDLTRADILSANAWRTATDAFAVFDPTAANVPFPNEFVRNGPNGEVTMPVDPEADALTAAVINELNARNGFANTANGWLPFAGAPLDPATVNADTIVLARTVDGFPKVYPAERYFLEYKQDWNLVAFGPLGSPFDANEVFGGNPDDNEVTAGIITTGVKDINGLEVKPSEAFIFLRSQHPIADDDGKSLVKELDDATAVALESARLSYAQLFVAGLVIGYGDRKEIANAWAFQTDNSTDEQQKLSARGKALALEGGALSAQGNVADVETPPTGAGFANIGMMQKQASFKTEFFLDPTNPFGLLEAPVEQDVAITVSVPDTTVCTDGPFPVIILGHGLGGNRDKAVDIFADALAAAPYCMASVAMDFPLHGPRAVPDVPFMSANAIATKNNFLQAGVDLTILAQVIKDGGLEGVLDADANTDLIDEDSIGYTGVSLGGILGTNFIATNDDVTVAALNVPGARLTEVIITGSLGADILEQLPPTDSFSFFQTASLLQWTIEPADPWIFAPHIASNDAADLDADKPLYSVLYDVSADSFSLGDRLSNNQVMIQMAGDDTTVPNPTTELLAGAMGVSLEHTTFEGALHGFIAGDDAAATCAKAQIATWLSSGLRSGTAELASEQLNACGL